MRRAFNYVSTFPDDQLFVGLEKVDRLPWMRLDYVECPKCYGHGAWNHSSHLRVSCDFCYGYGWIPPQRLDACDHLLLFDAKIGNCLTRYTCTKCGSHVNVDSSD